MSEKYPEIKTISLTMYRRIFRSFNIGFNIPKKDLCDQCKAYSILSDEAKIDQRQNYENHLLQQTTCKVVKKQGY